MYIAFLLALLSFWIGSFFFPTMALSFFAPVFIIVLYRRIEMLPWVLLIVGIGMDLLSDLPFGLFTLSFLGGALILPPLVHFFFVDRFWTLPLLTTIFSIASTTLQMGLISLFETGFFSITAFFRDAIFFSLFDGLYAILIFVVPFPGKKGLLCRA